MSKKENVKTNTIEYVVSYTLAAGDKIEFYCSNMSHGNLVGKSITNTSNSTMEVSYCQYDQSLYLIDLSGDN